MKTFDYNLSDYDPAEYELSTIIQMHKDEMRTSLSKVLGIAPEAIDDLALADLWCGPTVEAVKHRWDKKPWLQPGYVNTMNPWPVEAE